MKNGAFTYEKVWILADAHGAHHCRARIKLLGSNVVFQHRTVYKDSLPLI